MVLLHNSNVHIKYFGMFLLNKAALNSVSVQTRLFGTAVRATYYLRVYLVPTTSYCLRIHRWFKSSNMQTRFLGMFMLDAWLSIEDVQSRFLGTLMLNMVDSDLRPITYDLQPSTYL